MNSLQSGFEGYFYPSDESFRELWESACICFDSSVLLNLYDYSKSTSDEILGVLDNIKLRTWIPHQVAHEYHRNRSQKILENSRKYVDLSSELDRTINLLKSTKTHPFIEDSTLSKLDEIVVEIKESLVSVKDSVRESIRMDTIRDRLTIVFENRVGEEPSSEWLEVTYKEGETRYDKMIPPGYKDSKKPDPDKYGDLIIWLQSIERCRSNNSDLIFVTDDEKEDWWQLDRNNKVGPHPKLLNEFITATGKMAYIYNTATFVENASKYISQISEPTKKEIVENSRMKMELNNVRRLSNSLNHVERLSSMIKDFEKKSLSPTKEMKKTIKALDRLENTTPIYRQLEEIRRDPKLMRYLIESVTVSNDAEIEMNEE